MLCVNCKATLNVLPKITDSLAVAKTDIKIWRHKSVNCGSSICLPGWENSRWIKRLFPFYLPFGTTHCWTKHQILNIFITAEASAHTEYWVQFKQVQLTTSNLPLTRTILWFSALSSSLCPSNCLNGSNKYDGMWSERRDVRERTTLERRRVIKWAPT